MMEPRGPRRRLLPTITVAAPRSDPGRRTVVRAGLFRPRGTSVRLPGHRPIPRCPQASHPSGILDQDR